MKTFEKEFEVACRDGAIPGAVLVASNVDGTFKYEKAFQGQNLREGADSNYQLDSVLRYASLTKLVTSVAALQCVERGLLSLDDDVTKWLPEFKELKVLLECEEGKEPVFEDIKNPITLRHLLTHSSGLSYGTAEPLFQRYRSHTDTTSLAATSGTIHGAYFLPLIYQPGTVWHYGSSHDWAGKLISAATHLSLESYIQTHICQPLAITSMTFYLPSHPSLLRRNPQPSKRGKDGSMLKNALSGGTDDPSAPVYPFPDWPSRTYEEPFGGEGLASSIPDYHKLLHSLLLNDGKVLRPETVEMMFSPQLSPTAKEALNEAFHGPFAAMVAGRYPGHVQVDWGLGCMVTVEDEDKGDEGEGEREGRMGRGKGTAMWSGVANSFWWIDRVRGVCGVFGTQMLPSGDDRVGELLEGWEAEVYRLAAEAKG